MSTGWLSAAPKSIPLDKIAIKPLGLLMVSSFTWGIAIPLPTAVEPNLSRFIKLSIKDFELICKLSSAILVNSSNTCFLLTGFKPTINDSFDIISWIFDNLLNFQNEYYILKIVLGIVN